MESDRPTDTPGKRAIRFDGSLLNKARYDAQLTQMELASKVGVSQPTLSRAETGDRVSLEIALAIAAALDVPLQKLLSPEEPYHLTFPVESVPAQGAGPHFAIGATGRIANISPSAVDTEGNNSHRIEQLLPLVRQAADDLAVLLGPQDNAFPELARDLEQYRRAISETELAISWGLVWGLGVRLEESAAATERKINDRLAPALEDAALAALQSLRALHAPLILATAEGRSLQEQADLLRMTREEQAAFRTDAVALSDNLQRSDDIIEPDASAIVAEAAAAIGHGRHPERGTVFGIAAIKHTSIVLISAAAIAVPAHLIGGVVGTVATMGIWEGIKKSPIFAAAAAALGEEFNRLLKTGGIAARDCLSRLLPFRRFVLTNELHLRNVAASTPQLKWMLTYIDYVVEDKNEDTRPP